MKSRFNTIDLMSVVLELKQIIGMRLTQVYDVDNKTYIFKFGKPEEKCKLIVESGIRIHKTDYEWPKNPAPHGFTMKLRKHIKNKRLEIIEQLGVDRIVHMQFGINEAAYHVFVELYDKGNIVLTDNEYTILNILRPRTVEHEDVRLAVREKYPIELACQQQPSMNDEQLEKILKTAKDSDILKKLLNPHFIYGSAVIEHVLLSVGLPFDCKIGKDFDCSNILLLKSAIQKAEEIMKNVAETLSLGYIIQKVQKCPVNSNQDEIVTFIEFHPMLFKQHEKSSYLEFPTFNKAVDHFFSNIESQKIDIKTLQKEKEAMKKLENIKKDHMSRIGSLQNKQSEDEKKAQFIEMNLQLVDSAILGIRSAIANQLSWTDVWNYIQESQKQGDSIAKAVKALKLETNHFSMILNDPYVGNDYSESDQQTKPCLVDIDLDLSAYGNARKYYDMKRHAAKKEKKTIDSSFKAYKSAEKKAKQTLKEISVTSNIIKARKIFWFEKFLWFISSENYLVIAGRDVQQNEIIVKRYMKPGDIYVHADLHGASSILIKNPSGKPVPPKTLNEAGTMAVCYSAAWDAKVVTSAWWVYHHQVSKTAPTGEYLIPGSFMIRGKKNYLPPSHLIVGFGFLFKLDDDSIKNHLEDRKVKIDDDDDDKESLTNAEIISDNEINLDCVSDDDHHDVSADINNTIKIDDNVADISKDNISDKNELSDSEEKDENELHGFPDTIIKLPVESIDEKILNDTNNSDEQSLIIHTGKNKVKIKQVKPEIHIDCSKEENTEQNSQQQKRGQKSKLKKIKEKYKDQDDEERQLRMEILASAGKKNNKDKKNKGKELKQTSKSQKYQESKNENNEKVQRKSVNENKSIDKTFSPILPNKNISNETENIEKSDDDDANDDILLQNEDEKSINSLSGGPFPEDTILFSIPVCAPYSAMQNYKFKVKVTPGPGKRGKAAKAALNIFLNDKNITSREKDLLRSTKDQDICRNIPAKVKLSVAGLNKKK